LDRILVAQDEKKLSASCKRCKEHPILENTINFFTSTENIGISRRTLLLISLVYQPEDILQLRRPKVE
jgi:hypothetical protein